MTLTIGKERGGHAQSNERLDVANDYREMSRKGSQMGEG